MDSSAIDIQVLVKYRATNLIIEYRRPFVVERLPCTGVTPGYRLQIGSMTASIQLPS